MDEKQYLQYKENLRSYQAKYRKEHYRTITANVDKEFYETEIVPAVKKTGLTVSAWMRLAVIEKLERDKDK